MIQVHKLSIDKHVSNNYKISIKTVFKLKNTSVEKSCDLQQKTFEIKLAAEFIGLSSYQSACGPIGNTILGHYAILLEKFDR